MKYISGSWTLTPESEKEKSNLQKKKKKQTKKRKFTTLQILTLIKY